MSASGAAAGSCGQYASMMYARRAPHSVHPSHAPRNIGPQSNIGLLMVFADQVITVAEDNVCRIFDISSGGSCNAVLLPPHADLRSCRPLRRASCRVHLLPHPGICASGNLCEQDPAGQCSRYLLPLSPGDSAHPLLLQDRCSSGTSRPRSSSTSLRAGTPRSRAWHRRRPWT
jgi:hypothetical protein